MQTNQIGDTTPLVATSIALQQPTVKTESPVSKTSQKITQSTLLASNLPKEMQAAIDALEAQKNKRESDIAAGKARETEKNARLLSNSLSEIGVTEEGLLNQHLKMKAAFPQILAKLDQNSPEAKLLGKIVSDQKNSTPFESFSKKIIEISKGPKSDLDKVNAFNELYKTAEYADYIDFIVPMTANVDEFAACVPTYQKVVNETPDLLGVECGAGQNLIVYVQRPMRHTMLLESLEKYSTISLPAIQHTKNVNKEINSKVREFNDKINLEAAKMLPEILIKSNTDKIDYSLAKKIITANFGARIMGALELSFPPTKHNETITVGRFKELLIGVATKVSKNDLENLFKLLKGEKNVHGELFHCQHTILSDSDSLRTVHTFEDLTTDQIELLISAFRMVEIDGERVEINQNLLLGHKKLPITQNCLTTLKAFKDTDLYIQQEGSEDVEMKRYIASAENIAREWAYCLPLNNTPSESIENQLILVLDPQGNKHYYEIKRCVYEGGLEGYFCIPLNNNQEFDEDGKEIQKEMIVFFRGVYCKESFIRAVTEGPEAGSATFEELSEELMKCFDQTLAAMKSNNVRVNIRGHSMGGHDTMAFTKELAKRDAESYLQMAEFNEDGDIVNEQPVVRPPNFEKIKHVDIFCFNNPSLNPETCLTYNQNRAIIYKHNPIEFTHNYVHVEGDGVQNINRSVLGYVSPSERYGFNPVWNTRFFWVTPQKHTSSITTIQAHSQNATKSGVMPTTIEEVSDVYLNYYLGGKPIVHSIGSVVGGIAYNLITRNPAAQIVRGVYDQTASLIRRRVVEVKKQEILNS